ncbi:hypothetical protein ZWY2020_057416 [Hordeum vulgare]|nr:hypothetical protein ZWY2020_057416 [Hordeum vulgare]
MTMDSSLGNEVLGRGSSPDIEAEVSPRCSKDQKIVNRNNYGNDDYSKEFGMKVMNLLALVDARVLPAPRLGQALSTRPDILPIAYCQELSKLQDQIPPFPTRNAIRTIEFELGSRMSDLFADISPEPIAADHGQVYKAYISDLCSPN